MPRPQRTAGGHRQYSQRDIDMINWLIARQGEGMSISHAVKLWRTLNNEGDDPLNERESARNVDVYQATYAQASAEVENLRDEWIEACLSFNRLSAEQVLVRAFALFPPEVVCIQLLQSGLSKIGELWYEGQITVQQEHFASAMSVQRLEMLIAATPPPTRLARIIVASAEDDYHVFSPLLFTFLLRRRGWDVIYLGANMPAAALEETIGQLKPRMLIVSAQTLSTATSLLDITAALSGQETIIGYGGIIFNMMPQLQDRIPAHYLGRTIDGAVPVVERLIRQHASNPFVPPDQPYSQALSQFRQRRALIESDLWRHYVAKEKSTARLEEVNHDFAGIIMAALVFGTGDILSRDMEWIQYLSNNYQISETEANEYIDSYRRAAEVHLTGPARVIAEFLEEMSVNDVTHAPGHDM